MRNRLFKIPMIMFFLLTFISQAMASSFMSYKMMHMNFSSDISPVSQLNKHNAHDEIQSIGNDQSDAHQGKTCCADKRICLILGCSATTLTTDIFVQNIITSTSVNYVSSTLLTLSQQPKSLYRPPILA